MTQISDFDYPTLKCSREEGAPEFVNLDLFESEQVQEVWAIEGSVGPEIMIWLDGFFVYWWPCLTIERALKYASDADIGF